MNTPKATIEASDAVMKYFATKEKERECLPGKEVGPGPTESVTYDVGKYASYIIYCGLDLLELLSSSLESSLELGVTGLQGQPLSLPSSDATIGGFEAADISARCVKLLVPCLGLSGQFAALAWSDATFLEMVRCIYARYQGLTPHPWHGEEGAALLKAIRQRIESKVKKVTDLDKLLEASTLA